MTTALRLPLVRSVSGGMPTLDEDRPAEISNVPCEHIAGATGMPATIRFDMGTIGDGDLPAGTGAALSGIHVLNRITACEASTAVTFGGYTYHIRLEAFDDSGVKHWRASLWLCDGTTNWKRGRTTIEEGAGNEPTRIGGLLDATASYDYADFDLPAPTSPVGLPGWPDMSAAEGTISPYLITASVSVESATNPALIKLSKSASSDELVNPFVNESIDFEFPGPVIETFTDLRSDRYDLSAYEGQTATIRYKVSQTIGGNLESTEATTSVNIPVFAEKVTVDPGQSLSATNFHTITDAASAIAATGGLIQVAAGTYTLNTGGEAGRIPLSGKSNWVLRRLGAGTVTIDGNQPAATLNNAILTSGASECLIENIEFTNTHFSVASLDENVSGFVVKNCRIYACDKRGFTVAGGKDVTFHTVTFEDTVYAANPGTLEEGMGVYCDSVSQTIRAENIKFFDCLSRNNQSDGYQLRNVDGMHVDNCQGLSNGRQGFLLLGTQQITFENSDANNNVASGVQIENGASGFVLRNITALDNCVNRNGETGIWADDSSTGVIEFCTMSGNQQGSRLDSDVGGIVITNGLIFRFNLVVNNNRKDDLTTLGARAGNAGGLELHRITDSAIYNNTIVGNGNDTLSLDSGGFYSREDLSDGSDANLNIEFFNNIVGGMVANGNSSRKKTMQFEETNGPSQYPVLDHNVYYGHADATPFRRNATDEAFTAYQTAVAPKEANSVDADPNLDGSWIPQAGSIAIGAARPLTTVTASGTGTSVAIDSTRPIAVGDILDIGGEIVRADAKGVGSIVLNRSITVTAGASLLLAKHKMADIGAMQT
jgi:hypothetical protein